MEENYNKEKTQRKNDSKVIKKRPLLLKPYFNFPLQKEHKGFWPTGEPLYLNNTSIQHWFLSHWTTESAFYKIRETLYYLKLPYKLFSYLESLNFA